MPNPFLDPYLIRESPDVLRAEWTASAFFKPDRKKLLKFVKANGGWEQYGSTWEEQLAAAEKAMKESGAFTDLAKIPGEASPTALFAGARRDEQRTKVSDLKLPFIPTR